MSSPNEKGGPGQQSQARSPQPLERLSRDVITRFVAGDKQAFQQVFAELKQDTFWVVSRFFKGAFDQEEAMQEVWLKLYRAKGRFDVNRHQEFVAWTRQVARNRCLDLLKARGRRLERPWETLEPACPPQQAHRLAQKRTQDAIARWAASLPEQEGQFFRLCFVEELSHEEVAQKLAITLRRSKYLKKKLLQRMAQAAAFQSRRES